jgi:C-terminal processing protease CtpA/Prc
VTLGRYEFERPLLAADIIPEQFPADGIIGMHSLSAFSVALDQRTRRIRFTRSQPVIAAPGSLHGHGVAIAYGLEHLEVASVLPDSPEAEAALRNGDRIVEINGRSTAGFAPSDWEPLSESAAPLVLLIERGGKSMTVTLPARLLVR